MERHDEGRHRPTGGEAPLLILIVLAVLLVLLGFFIHGDFSPAGPEFPGVVDITMATATSAPSESTTSTTIGDDLADPGELVHPIRDPAWIAIPAIGVSAPVIPVGLLANGDMETPHSGSAGWYSLGPAPGEPGPAVMLAHVDTYSRPDVFYRLKDLKPGDEISVYGASGDPAVFVVESVEQQLKIDLPRDRIWSYTATALIRLITCGGKWDSRSQHYLSNVIVYGHLVR